MILVLLEIKHTFQQRKNFKNW